MKTIGMIVAVELQAVLDKYGGKLVEKTSRASGYWNTPPNAAK